MANIACATGAARSPPLLLAVGKQSLGGLCKGATHAIGLRSIAADLGFVWSLKLMTDSTAAIGISRRLGLGKIRHLDTSLLWIQDKIRTNDVGLGKVLGTSNPADALTKYLSGPDLCKHLVTMGLYAEEGRAASAPKMSK